MPTYNRLAPPSNVTLPHKILKTTPIPPIKTTSVPINNTKIILRKRKSVGQPLQLLFGSDYDICLTS